MNFPKFFDIPTATLEITPHSLCLQKNLNAPPLIQQIQEVDDAALEGFIRGADGEGFVLDLILCGPQTRVEFAPPAQAGADIVGWAEQLVASWLPRGMEPDDAVWSLDTFEALGVGAPFCMFSLFRKGYLQSISNALAKTGCVLRSVHGGAYSLLSNIRLESEPYAMLQLSQRGTRVLLVEQGMPVSYHELSHTENCAPAQRVKEIERLTNYFLQVHRSKEMIGRFVIGGDENEIIGGLLSSKGYSVITSSLGPQSHNSKTEENLPPEIGEGHGRAYAKMLRSRDRFRVSLKRLAIAGAVCCVLLGLFEASIRIEKIVRAEKYRAGEAALKLYSESRVGLAAIELRYGDFFSSIAHSGDVPLYIDAVIQTLPERIWLSELSYKTGKEKSLEFVGYTDDATQIAPFLGRLQAHRSIAGVEQRFIEVMSKDRVAQMTRHGQGARELTKFKAEAMLK